MGVAQAVAVFAILQPAILLVPLPLQTLLGTSQTLLPLQSAVGMIGLIPALKLAATLLLSVGTGNIVQPAVWRQLVARSVADLAIGLFVLVTLVTQRAGVLLVTLAIHIPAEMLGALAVLRVPSAPGALIELVALVQLIALPSLGFLIRAHHTIAVAGVHATRRRRRCRRCRLIWRKPHRLLGARLIIPGRKLGCRRPLIADIRRRLGTSGHPGPTRSIGEGLVALL